MQPPNDDCIFRNSIIQWYGIRHQAPRYLANIENKEQHPSLQIFIELVTRYDISVDQYLFSDKVDDNTTQRRQLDTLLNGLDHKGMKIIAATARGIHQPASAHRLPRSGAVRSGFFSTGFLSAQSFFASASFSRMKAFSSVLGGTSSLRPLWISQSCSSGRYRDRHPGGIFSHSCPWNRPWAGSLRCSMRYTLKCFQ